METEQIYPNLHITKPLDVKAFRSGNIKIPTEITAYKPFSGRIGTMLF